MSGACEERDPRDEPPSSDDDSDEPHSSVDDDTVKEIDLTPFDLRCEAECRAERKRCAERARLRRVAQKRKEARHARGLRPRGRPKKLPEPPSAAPKRPRGRPVDPSSKRQRRLALQLEATRECEAAKAEAAERKRRLLEMTPAEREAYDREQYDLYVKHATERLSEERQRSSEQKYLLRDRSEGLRDVPPEIREEVPPPPPPSPHPPSPSPPPPSLPSPLHRS